MEEIIRKINQRRINTQNIKSKKVYKKLLNLLQELRRKKISEDSFSKLEQLIFVFNDDSLSIETTKKHMEILKKTLIKDYNFLPEHYFTGKWTGIGAGIGICSGIILGLLYYGYPMGLINGIIIGSGLGITIGYIVGGTLDNKAKSKNRILYHL